MTDKDLDLTAFIMNTYIGQGKTMPADYWGKKNGYRIDDLEKRQKRVLKDLVDIVNRLESIEQAILVLQRKLPAARRLPADD